MRGPSRHGRKAIIPGAGTYVCDRRAAEVASLVRDFTTRKDIP